MVGVREVTRPILPRLLHHLLRMSQKAMLHRKQRLPLLHMQRTGMVRHKAVMARMALHRMPRTVMLRRRTGNGAYAPVQPVQQRKSGRGKLWLIIGSIVGILLIAAIVIGIIGYEGYVNRSTTTKTLNAYCSALKGGDYKAAYSELSTGLQAKFGSEAAFAQAYSTNGGLGKITNCTVSNANDSANTGTISYVLSQGDAHSLVVDYGLVNENNLVKINAQTPRSTPTLTLTDYCNALSQQDYKTAYNQFSADLQSQIGGESQFASSAAAENIKGCTVKNADDAAGTGTLTYIRTDGNSTSATATLANEKGTWKINKLQSICHQPTRC